MKIIQHMRAADRVAGPWKNGGGVTSDVVVHPPGASLDRFDWRVSIARVVRDGPFSSFPGIERSLAVLDGNGFILEMAGAEPVKLTARSTPFAFAADVATAAQLIDGPATDLNVMTRRGNVGHRLQRLDLHPSTPLARMFANAILVWGDGHGSIEVADDIVRPARHDAVRFDQPTVATLEAVTPATVYLIELTTASSAGAFRDAAASSAAWTSKSGRRKNWLGKFGSFRLASARCCIRHRHEVRLAGQLSARSP